MNVALEFVQLPSWQAPANAVVQSTAAQTRWATVSAAAEGAVGCVILGKCGARENSAANEPKPRAVRVRAVQGPRTCSVWATHEDAAGLVQISAPQARYLELHEAVASLALLPQDDASYVDETTVKSATRLLSLMCLYDVPAPRIFSHGGDSVVFTWQRGPTRIYVTICEDEAAILESHPRASIACTTNVSLGNIERPLDLMKVLGGGPWKASAI